MIGPSSSTTLSQLYQGRLPSKTDEQGRIKQFLNDTDGNLIKATYPADNTFEEYSYNSFGQITRKRSRTGDVELFTYDA